MKDFFKKQREILAIIGYATIVFLLIYFAVFSLIKKIDGINYQLQEEGMKQEIARQHISELPKIQKQYIELENSLDLTRVLLDENEAVTLIEKLEKTAKDTENDIVIEVQAQVDQKKVSVKAKPGDEVPLIEELPSQDYLQLKITLNGEYGPIVKFIKEIEGFEYYCDITEVQINKSEVLSKVRSGSETANPFDFSAKKENEGVENDKIDKLSASLTVMFYKKQK